MPITFTFLQCKLLYVNIALTIHKLKTISLARLLEDGAKIRTDLLQAKGKPEHKNILESVLKIEFTIKLVLSCFTLITNPAAMYTILTRESPILLWPIVVALSLEYVVLSVVELVIGAIACCFFLNGKCADYAEFFCKTLCKILITLSVISMCMTLMSDIEEGRARVERSKHFTRFGF